MAEEWSDFCKFTQGWARTKIQVSCLPSFTTTTQTANYDNENIHSAYYAPDLLYTVLITSYIGTHLISRTIYHYAYYIDEETGAQRGELSFPRPIANTRYLWIERS